MKQLVERAQLADELLAALDAEREKNSAKEASGTRTSVQPLVRTLVLDFASDVSAEQRQLVTAAIQAALDTVSKRVQVEHEKPVHNDALKEIRDKLETLQCQAEATAARALPEMMARLDRTEAERDAWRAAKAESDDQWRMKVADVLAQNATLLEIAEQFARDLEPIGHSFLAKEWRSRFANISASVHERDKKLVQKGRDEAHNALNEEIEQWLLTRADERLDATIQRRLHSAPWGGKLLERIAALSERITREATQAEQARCVALLRQKSKQWHDTHSGYGPGVWRQIADTLDSAADAIKPE